MLEQLEPKNVFSYFEKICSIPHGSGNIQGISNYLAEFAKERNLEYIQDETYNVIIKKDASKGYEQMEPVTLNICCKTHFFVEKFGEWEKWL